MEFEREITTVEALRELIPQFPDNPTINKHIDHIDDICARFIAACPFLIMASKGGDGLLDQSPKGDAPGFVKVLDEKHIAIPDRLGNRRLDTFNNIIADPQVGLLFLIPGNGDTLRVAGTGRIVADEALRSQFPVNKKIPDLVLVVRVEEAFMHCPKCVKRSNLWRSEHWPDRTNVPTLAEAMVKHGELARSIEEMQTTIDMDGERRLY